ncbi:MAG: hypothetical protein JST26_01660 [Bacteroidetes bacterium]|nr:hypothetical protein [Bacteroidota bacterium]
MSIITIDSKILKAKEQSEFLFKQKATWQEQVDDLLDRMNELNRLLTHLHSILLNLSFELERDFSNFKQSHIAPEGIKSITVVTSKILRLVRKSDLYPGVKSTYSSIKQENDLLKELLHDRQIGLELDLDAEMQKIISDSLKVAKRK